MGTIAGRSAGFGRIGENTRTSLYSPVHLSSTPSAAPPSDAPRFIYSYAAPFGDPLSDPESLWRVWRTAW